MRDVGTNSSLMHTIERLPEMQGIMNVFSVLIDISKLTCRLMDNFFLVKTAHNHSLLELEGTHATTFRMNKTS